MEGTARSHVTLTLRQDDTLLLDAMWRDGTREVRTIARLCEAVDAVVEVTPDSELLDRETASARRVAKIIQRDGVPKSKAETQKRLRALLDDLDQKRDAIFEKELKSRLSLGSKVFFELRKSARSRYFWYGLSVAAGLHLGRIFDYILR